MGDELDRAAWLEDARQTAAEALVKRAVADGSVCIGSQPPAASSSSSSTRKSSTGDAFGGPMVDLPSLRLALRVCVARLAQSSFLRCEASGMLDGTGGSAPPKPAPLTPAEWQALMKHPALSAATPASAMRPPSFDAAWLERKFISSLHLSKPQGRAKKAARGKSSRAKTGRRNSSGKQRRPGDEEEEGEGAGEGRPPSNPLRSSWDTDAGSSSGARGGEGTRRAPSSAARSSSAPGAAGEPSRHLNSSDDDEERPSTGPGGEDGDGDDECEAAAEELGRRDRAPSAAAAGMVQELRDDEEAGLLPALDVTDEQVAGMDAFAALQLARQVVEALGRWHVQTHINGMNNIWVSVSQGVRSGGRHFSTQRSFGSHAAHPPVPLL